MGVRVLTGAIDSGKTSWMLQRSALAGRAAWLSVKVFDGSPSADSFRGYDLLMLPSPKRVPLARILSATEVGPDWFSFRRFAFNPAGFAAGAAYLNDLELDSIEELLLDEAGPLEMEGRGFAPLLSSLLKTGSDLVVSVRPSLVERLPERFSFSPEEVIRL